MFVGNVIVNSKVNPYLMHIPLSLFSFPIVLSRCTFHSDKLTFTIIFYAVVFHLSFMDPNNFEKVINDCLKSCTSTEMSTGPMPRWQRKLQAQSNARPLSPLVNGSDTPAKRASCITPGKVKSGVEATKKTPGNCYIEK